MGRIRLTARDMRDERVASRACRFFVHAPSPMGEPIMTRTLRGSLLIASMLVVTWATTSDACHRRRACARNRRAAATGGVRLREPHGLLRRRWRLRHGRRRLLRRRVLPATRRLRRLSRRVRLRPARLQPGRPRRAGVRVGCRPGLGFGGFGPGADRPHLFRPPHGGAPARTCGSGRGDLAGSRLSGLTAGGRRPTLAPRHRRPGSFADLHSGPGRSAGTAGHAGAGSCASEVALKSWGSSRFKSRWILGICSRAAASPIAASSFALMNSEGSMPVTSGSMTTSAG